MPLPPYYQFIDPLLRVLGRYSAPVKAALAASEVADLLDLSDEDRSAVLPSGQQRVYANRVGWAHDALKRLGFSISRGRGQWILTPKGRDFLAAHPQQLNPDQQYALAKKGDRVARVADVVQHQGTEKLLPRDLAESPEERIEAAVADLRHSVAAEILENILASSPDFFERLVLDVLHAMGYGVTRSDLQTVGGTADGGIDGVITLDRLGLEKVYVQAKRWQGTVGRPQIQAFFGALAGVRASKGVFITTSSFSKDAERYAADVSASLVLVDGPQLSSLMIDHGVGVSTHREYRVVRVDGDYFDEL